MFKLCSDGPHFYGIQALMQSVSACALGLHAGLQSAEKQGSEHEGTSDPTAMLFLNLARGTDMHGRRATRLSLDIPVTCTSRGLISIWHVLSHGKQSPPTLFPPFPPPDPPPPFSSPPTTPGRLWEHDKAAAQAMLFFFRLLPHLLPRVTAQDFAAFVAPQALM